MISTPEKISKAEIEKKAGNEFFQAGNVRQAIKRYHIALLYLKDIEKPSPLEKLAGVEEGKNKKVSDEDLFLINSLRGICYNNLAACLLKQEKRNYEKVIDYTSKTLAVDPNNIKALFRRGQAYLYTNDIDRSEMDFMMIKSLDQEDKCIVKFVSLIEVERKRQMCKEKNLYKKMMNTAQPTWPLRLPKSIDPRMLSVVTVVTKLDQRNDHPKD